MTAEVLLGELDRICEAPDAISRLRRFILDLAVRGKLVPQDPNDEPMRLPQSWGTDDTSPEITFEIPGSWAWAKVSNVAESRLGKMLDKAKNKGTERRYLRNVNVRWFDFDLSDVYTMPFEDSELSEFALRVGDVLICEGGEPGRAAVWDGRENGIYFQKAVHRLRFPQHVNSHYFVAVMKQAAESDRLAALFTGVGIKHLTGRGLADFLLPLPPLAEQHRIVAKVDELTAMCDQLESARNAREEYRDKLVAASLHRLGQPASDAAADRDHARFTLDHLAPLTTRPEHIKQLRQAILNLAVRGKLVSQDPRDEPASELLRQILVHKNENIGGKNGYAHENFGATRSGEFPVALPSGWIWSTFGAIMISRDSERVPISKDERSRRAKLYDYYGASGIIDKIDGYLFDEPLLLIGEDGANLINRSSPIAFIARGKYWVNNHAHVLGAITEDLLRYVELHINAIDLKPYVTGTAQPKMNQAKMNSIPIALPPLAEQRRIVARVDELIALCDQLEAQLVTTESESRRLIEAALHEALGQAV